MTRLALFSFAVVTLASSQALARAVALKVPGFRSAVVVAPKQTKGAQPVVVALHGNFDRPEWNCEVLPALVRGRAWLLCIRGRPRRDTPKEWNRWTYGARARVKKEIEAALKALREKHPGRVADGPPLLAGFSLGAIYSARFAVARPKEFPLLYLVEGSQKVWKWKAIRRFGRRGGKGVLFGCGRRGCGAWSRRLCRSFARVKVWCAEVTVPTLGHSYTEPLPQKALPHFEKMVALDPRWK